MRRYSGNKTVGSAVALVVGLGLKAVCLLLFLCAGLAAVRGVAAEDEGAEAREKQGYLLMQQGDYDGAAAAFDAALKMNPRLKGAQTGKGLVLLRKGDSQAAEAVLKEALVLNPNPSPTHYALGLVYESRGDYANAVLQFKEGIKKNKGGGK